MKIRAYVRKICEKCRLIRRRGRINKWNALAVRSQVGQ